MGQGDGLTGVPERMWRTSIRTRTRTRWRTRWRHEVDQQEVRRIRGR